MDLRTHMSQPLKQHLCIAHQHTNTQTTLCVSVAAISELLGLLLVLFIFFVFGAMCYIKLPLPSSFERT